MGDVGHRVLDTAMAALIAEGNTTDKWGWGGAWRAWYFWAQSNLYFCAVDEAWTGARRAWRSRCLQHILWGGEDLARV